eukprot:tig00000381_g24529.t1
MAFCSAAPLRTEFVASSSGLGYFSAFGNSLIAAPAAPAPQNEGLAITMAVPKKHKSRQKTASAKATWKRKAKVAADRAWSLYHSIMSGNSTRISSLPDNKYVKKILELDAPAESA